MAGYRVNDDKTAWQGMDGEAVVINTDTSAYYSLNPPGSRIFEMLAAGPHTLDELSKDAAETYGVPVEEATGEIAALLEALLDEGLIVETGSTGRTAAASNPANHGAGAWEPPSLTRHGELEQLVLSGE